MLRRNLTLRVHDRTRALLKEAAESNGRSVSEQVEYMIEQAFKEDRLLELVLDIRHMLMRHLDKPPADQCQWW
jgi:uncharacterized protein (DUF1778 family)